MYERSIHKIGRFYLKNRLFAVFVSFETILQYFRMMVPKRRRNNNEDARKSIR